MNESLKKLSFWLGPVAYLAISFWLEPKGLTPEARQVLATVTWVAIWWIFESIPLAVTALLPILLLNIGTGLGTKEITTGYAHPYIFLFLGGFVLALAIEKCGLHRRIALQIMMLTGTRLSSIVLGYMLATAFLSMWISNTATVVMMLPLALASNRLLEAQTGIDPASSSRFKTVLLLGLAYAASIGGMATLIGTPPNLILAGIIEEYFDIRLEFFQWFRYGFPVSMALLTLCWFYLTRSGINLNKLGFPGGKAPVRQQLAEMGKMKVSEKRTLTVFVSTACLWMFHSLLPEPVSGFLNDTNIALLAAVSLVLIRDPELEKPLMNWNDIVKLPWGVLLLFGGGIALANAFDKSGLAVWMGNGIRDMEVFPVFVILIILVAAVNFITEITSNLATCAVLLPVLASFSQTLGLHPFVLMIPATLAASCAFMMPVATPPNAIVFGSGQVQIRQMVRIGVVMNLLSILVISLFAILVLS